MKLVIRFFLILFIYFNTLGATVCNAESIGQALDFDSEKINSYKLHAEMHYKNKEFDKAALYYELYTSKNDSIKEIGIEKNIALLNAKYAYQVKEAKLDKEQTLEQKRLENLIQEKKLAQSKLVIIFIFLAISFLIIIGYLLLIKNRNNALIKQRHEIEKLSEKQREIIEKKTSELLSSNSAISHYAFLNSHELRAPLAKILSIVYLFDQMNIKEDTFLQLLKECAKELEIAAKTIVQQLPIKNGGNNDIQEDSNYIMPS